MHPFGGTQYCPKCSKAVYAAEQVMGPGRKLYHKPCLACMSCNKRLDSYTLLEHDQMPYCKSCHSKNFGNRDLRQANLPHYDITPAPSTSPIRGSATRVSSTNGVATPRMKLSGFWATSPASAFPRADPKVAPLNEAAQGETDAQESQDTMDESSVSPCPISDSPPMNTTQSDVCGRAGFGTPRTISPSPSRRSDTSIRLRHFTNNSVGSISTSSPKMEFSRLAGALPVGRESSVNQCETEREAVRPLLRMSPGTRYGAALGSGVGVQVTGSGLSKKWGAGTPNCPRCGKSVYFAEQVKAVGKTYHKDCLRCMECSTLLDSNRLRDHDGDPLCVKCYGKLHGPQGAGYALLGKAGG